MVGGKKKDRYVLYVWKKGPDGKITYFAGVVAGGFVSRDWATSLEAALGPPLAVWRSLPR